MQSRVKKQLIGKEPTQKREKAKVFKPVSQQQPVERKKAKVFKPVSQQQVIDKPIAKKAIRIRRVKDGTYKPGKETRRKITKRSEAQRLNILKMRTHTATEFTSPQGSKHALQSSVLFQIGYSPRTHAKVDAELKKIPSYKPPVEVILNPAGSPIAVKIESGEILERKTSYESFMYFNSAPPVETSQPMQTRLSTDSAFFQTDQYKKLKKIKDTYKLQEKTISDEDVAKRQQEKKIRKGRATSQSSKMVEQGVSAKVWGKATDYVIATELFDDTIKAEWLHKLPYAIFGEDSQTDANLVAGTNHANTDMMFIEEYIPYLQQRYPNGVRLRVKADLIPGTHIATTITYEIITPDCRIPPLVFNAQNRIKPHFLILEFMRVFIDAVTDRKDPLPTPISTPPLPFFKRKRVEVQAQDMPVKKKARVEAIDEAPECSAPRASADITLFSSKGKRKLDFSDEALSLDESERSQPSSSF